VGRDRRPHGFPGGHGRPRYHRGPQGGRGRRAPVRRGAKNRKRRQTIYPCTTPSGYPLAERLAARIEQARTEQESGSNPLGLVFPSPHGKHWRSSNFDRNVLKRAYLETGWRDADGNGDWTWHSLRHAFCTTALFTWKLDITDVSRMAGHANYRITLDMYVGSTAGVLDRARTATE
jgi:integrase